MLPRTVHIYSFAAILAIAPLCSSATEELLAVQVSGVDAANTSRVAKVVQSRVDELRTGWLGSTSSRVSGNLIVVSTSGWSPDRSLAEAVVLSDRQLRLVIEPSADVLLNESDVADARPGIGSRPELALRLNEAGVSKLKMRRGTLIGKVVSAYWNGHLISRARIGDELIQDIAISVPSVRDASLIAAVLRAGALPGSASLAPAK